MKNMLPPDSLLASILGSGRPLRDAVLVAPHATATVTDLVEQRTGLPPQLAGARVALSAKSAFDFVETLVAFDGYVASMLLLAGDLPEATAQELAASHDAGQPMSDLSWKDAGAADTPNAECATIWQLTTSGTTGVPKVVSHLFQNLTRTVKPPRQDGQALVWGLLYDPSRFAGLQVVFQALLGGGRLLLCDLHDDLASRLRFFAKNECSHLSATPSLWRKILMLPEAGALNLRQITLGGEIADERLLANLSRQFPNARISHIYASTEIGVGFVVSDKHAGFPLSYLDRELGGLCLRVKGEYLWIRPTAGVPRAQAGHIVTDDDGFICTNDRVELRGDRVHFLGRDSSVVNVGGVKVQIEALEQLLREHELVSDCWFSAVPNPIVGNVLEVSIVPAGSVDDEPGLKKAIRTWCRQNFQAEAVPARVRIVAEMPLSGAGKIGRFKR